jgi:hypothetical protein
MIIGITVPANNRLQRTVMEKRFELRVEEQGFRAQSEISKLELSWRAFAKWFRLKDGFLVTRPERGSPVARLYSC